MQRVHPRLGALEPAVVVGGVGAGNPGHHELRDLVAHATARPSRVATSVSGPTARGRSASARAWPRRTPARRRQAGSLPVRGTWGAQISRRAGTLRMVAGLRAARARGPGVRRPAAVRPGIDVLLTDSLAVVRGRRVGLVTNQAGVDAQGISDVVRSAGGRRAARGAVQPRARLPRRGRSGRRGRLVHRFGHRSTNLQSLRPEYRPHRRHARRHRPAAGRPARRGRAVLHLPVHDGRGDALGGAARRAGRRARPARPDRRGRCRATCSTRRTARRSGCSPCRCATA